MHSRPVSGADGLPGRINPALWPVMQKKTADTSYGDTRTGAKAKGDEPEPGPEASFLSAHPEEERRMPGCVIEKAGEGEREGSRNVSVDHKLHDFHKSDSQMGAAAPRQSSQQLSSRSHIQAGSGLET